MTCRLSDAQTTIITLESKLADLERAVAVERTARAVVDTEKMALAQQVEELKQEKNDLFKAMAANNSNPTVDGTVLGLAGAVTSQLELEIQSLVRHEESSPCAPVYARACLAMACSRIRSPFFGARLPHAALSFSRTLLGGQPQRD